MGRRKLLLATALLAPIERGVAQGLAFGSPATARTRPPIEVGRFAGPVVVDGKLDEAAWQAAARLEGFVQTQPGDNTPPTYPTVVMLGFDDRTLFIGIHATDDSAKVRATLARRDQLGGDDIISIVMDTYGDRRRAYVFGFNPLGVQTDGVYTEGDSAADLSFDIVMTSRGRIDGTGWTVEAAIPLSAIRYASAPNQRWHVQVQRRIRHLNNEQDSWMPMVRGYDGFLAQAGVLTGLEHLPIRHAVQLIPSVTASREGTRTASPAAGLPDGFADGRVGREVGLSAKATMAAGVISELALNPDFAQVEADAPVVTANQRFPIFFEEKRPFFLEGVDLLRTPLQVVHTRAIVDPDAAAKLTGERGHSRFAVLAGLDRAPGVYTSAERADSARQGEIAQYGGRDAAVAVVRWRQSVGAASTAGLLATGYRFVDRENLSAGFDGRLAIGSNSSVTFQTTGTWARQPFYEPELGRDTMRVGKGLGYYVSARRTERHFGATLSGKGRSADYVSTIGFTPQTNVNSWSLDTRWDAEPRPAAALISWSAAHTVNATFDWSGRMVYAFLWPHASVTLPRQTTITVGAYADYQRLFEEEFGPKRSATQTGAFAGAGIRRTVYRGYNVTGGSTPIRSLELSWMLDESWDTFDYDFGGGPRFPRVSPAALADPAAPLDPGPGHTTDAIVGATWRPNAALRFKGSFTKSRLRRNDTHLLAYDENLSTGEATYQLTRFLSVRARADYRSSLRDVRPQGLFAWTPSPGTVIYLGYNDDLTVDGHSPLTGVRERGVRRNSRTVFAKASYLVQSSPR